jgi:hypothetical protein
MVADALAKEEAANELGIAVGGGAYTTQDGENARRARAARGLLPAEVLNTRIKVKKAEYLKTLKAPKQTSALPGGAMMGGPFGGLGGLQAMLGQAATAGLPGAGAQGRGPMDAFRTAAAPRGRPVLDGFVDALRRDLEPSLPANNETWDLFSDIASGVIDEEDEGVLA